MTQQTLDKTSTSTVTGDTSKNPESDKKRIVFTGIWFSEDGSVPKEVLENNDLFCCHDSTSRFNTSIRSKKEHKITIPPDKSDDGDQDSESIYHR